MSDPSYEILSQRGRCLLSNKDDKHKDKDKYKDKDNDKDKYIYRAPSKSDPRDL